MSDQDTTGWDRIRVFEHLQKVLVAEQALRNERRGTKASSVDSLGRDIYTLEWIAAEHNAMLRAVDELRAARGLPQIDRMFVARAEQMAAGHVDYTKKYALYCADLVFDAPLRP